MISRRHVSQGDAALLHNVSERRLLRVGACVLACVCVCVLSQHQGSSLCWLYWVQGCGCFLKKGQRTKEVGTIRSCVLQSGAGCLARPLPGLAYPSRFGGEMRERSAPYSHELNHVGASQWNAASPIFFSAKAISPRICAQRRHVPGTRSLPADSTHTPSIVAAPSRAPSRQGPTVSREARSCPKRVLSGLRRSSSASAQRLGTTASPGLASTLHVWTEGPSRARRPSHRHRRRLSGRHRSNPAAHSHFAGASDPRGKKRRMKPALRPSRKLLPALACALRKCETALCQPLVWRSAFCQTTGHPAP